MILNNAFLFDTVSNKLIITCETESFSLGTNMRIPLSPLKS